MSKRILILGIDGMLGHKMFEVLSKTNTVYGTSRRESNIEGKKLESVIYELDVCDYIKLESVIEGIKPDLVINCVGIIKQKNTDDEMFLRINSKFPRDLETICERNNTEVLQISTDCVFSGKTGNYTETDIPDAHDIYGLSKYLGELKGRNTLTIRTSIIGHELETNYSLINWFLSQKYSVNGFTNAIYTGLPTVVLSRIIDKYIIQNTFYERNCGIYHITSDPISKFDLLRIVKEVYNKDIEIKPFHDFDKNMSLDSDVFRNLTGFRPENWGVLIREMYEDYMESGNYNID